MGRIRNLWVYLLFYSFYITIFVVVVLWMTEGFSS